MSLAPLPLTLLSITSAEIVADRGYASHPFRDLIWNLGDRPAILVKHNEADVACPPCIYYNANRVERVWARPRECRSVAAHHEKFSRRFMNMLCMAAIDWIK